MEKRAITIVGISARTNNADEMSGKGVIGAMWGKFFQQGILQKIPDRADSNIIALYTDYESDHTGAYTFVLGARVNSAAHIPEGMVAKTVPAGKYTSFLSEKGEVSSVVPQAWQQIWKASHNELGGKRAFTADYEIYDERSHDPHSGQVEIVIGVK